MKVLLYLLYSLPEILKILKFLAKKNDVDSSEVTRKQVKDDVKKINEAFDNFDAEALRAVFNPSYVPKRDSVPDDSKQKSE